MLQMRHRDGRVYTPGRDIVQLFKVICGGACDLLAAHNWPPALKEYAQFKGLTQKDLVPVGEALAKFVALSTHRAAADLETVYVNSGFDKLPGPVKVATAYAVGIVTMATYYQSVRGATREATSPFGADTMADALSRMAHALSADTDRGRAQRAAEMRKTTTDEMIGDSDHA